MNDPIEEAVRAVLLLAVVLAVIVALGFGLLLLGDEVGLWQFDSGLGAEAGDR